jgi:hypothetical protein
MNDEVFGEGSLAKTFGLVRSKDPSMKMDDKVLHTDMFLKDRGKSFELQVQEHKSSEVLNEEQKIQEMEQKSRTPVPNFEYDEDEFDEMQLQSSRR